MINQMLKQTSADMLLLLFLIHLILVPITATATATTLISEELPGCPSKCGNVSIPYPFGIGKECYLDIGYSITCDEHNSRGYPVPFLGTGNIEILNLSHDAQVIVNGRLGIDCYNSSGAVVKYVNAWTDLKETPFWFSATRNLFTAIGCDTIAFFSESKDQDFLSGCVSVCSNEKSVIEGSCSGIGCCQTAIPQRLKRYNVTLGSVHQHSKSWEYNPCSYGFLADIDSFTFKLSDLSANGYFNRTNLPVVLDWAIGHNTCDEVRKEAPASYACRSNSNCVNSDNGPGYRCHCNKGYQGNPYLPQGCQDIDECEDNPCEGLCHNTNGSYTCSCKGGYHGDGIKDGSGCTPDTFPVIILVSGSYPLDHSQHLNKN
ncbi:hypothetical protein HHK36_010524 [Tetracentron sinense]|uniref:EGF-like domain-containing protein n=1 Tax=Tetracentron sinense TaxID=13715 RepID=A0A835DMG1_TETSI|nr:hypothetical protein HHK36_010524 [Tetracentron sinense]